MLLGRVHPNAFKSTDILPPLTQVLSLAAATGIGPPLALMISERARSPPGETTFELVFPLLFTLSLGPHSTKNQCII
jgi:hypothetical protein